MCPITGWVSFFRDARTWIGVVGMSGGAGGTAARPAVPSSALPVRRPTVRP
ncbi:hypothetical protein GCM10018980_53870 [Streptomyces capoamus]|uniref:Uncharacterized protein n=1 Tax=Streptomyces capoamus TaxID=68183 RepID=A0A919EZW6_9ACTN|nr:hypothetical protein [Streptomyces capoamus]GGW18047.1 hypothetical protein GCM10010501_42030 [Streptomyces libani subsp. rufus]GHG63358.1 hypothetical protein GCM10018980_53870 [Streptomyces capoamus]